MAQGIDLRGSDQVLAAFNLNATPFFAVYQGKDLKFQHLEENLDSAIELLETNLNVLEANGSVAPFKIIYYYELNGSGKLVKENEKGSNTFRVVNPGAGVNMGNYGGGEYAVNNWQVKRGNTALEDRLEKLELALAEKESEESESEEPAAVGGVQGVIMGLMNNPQIQEIIIGRLLGLLDKVLPPPANNAPAMIAGATDQDAQLTKCLQTLFSKGMTLSDIQKLTTIAETQTPYFNTLLSMLRN